MSMPGMMDTVLNLGLNDQSINGLIKQTDNPRFAWDSYRRFIQMFSNVVMGLDGDLFENAIVGGAIPKEYIPAVDQGIQGAMQAGVLAGYPVVDVKVHLTFGSYHEVDSSEMAFKIAGSMAFKEACQKAEPTLLEPIMKVSVIVPDATWATSSAT